VLRAVQVVVDEKLARPVLVGRPAVLEKRIERFGLRLTVGEHFDVVNPSGTPATGDYWTSTTASRSGAGLGPVREDQMRRRHTLIGAMMMHKGEAAAWICGRSARTSAPALRRAR